MSKLHFSISKFSVIVLVYQWWERKDCLAFSIAAE